ncbi:DUF6328 family protein [Nonomuraea sp. NPDC049784]|uniref:DUF6328 family protein n=1 Tax=Nonomuraea sp. NPDC049784 TaxID=3154361 RepID=UPI0033DB4687
MTLPGSESHESHTVRVNRELGELVQELRVAVTGVQVLFGFLLTVPFQAGYGRLDAIGLALYLVALLGAATASVCFIAPAVQHRLLFRTKLKEKVLKRGNRLAIIGSVSLAVAISGAVALVMEYVLRNPMVSLVGAGVAAAVTWLWWLQPLADLRNRPRDHLS